MLNSEDRDAIDDLFVRLAEIERRSGPRDAEAEALIARRIAEQPWAPYYLAQTVVMQQRALNEAERRLAEQGERTRRQESGGPWDRSAPNRGGFLGGALQTALGVAGGVMLGNMLGSIFSAGTAQAEESNAADDSGDPADEGGEGDFDMGGDF